MSSHFGSVAGIDGTEELSHIVTHLVPSRPFVSGFACRHGTVIGMSGVSNIFFRLRLRQWKPGVSIHGLSTNKIGAAVEQNGKAPEARSPAAARRR
jgi:hypothetical protein